MRLDLLEDRLAGEMEAAQQARRNKIACGFVSPRQVSSINPRPAPPRSCARSPGETPPAAGSTVAPQPASAAGLPAGPPGAPASWPHPWRGRPGGAGRGPGRCLRGPYHAHGCHRPRPRPRERDWPGSPHVRIVATSIES